MYKTKPICPQCMEPKVSQPSLSSNVKVTNLNINQHKANINRFINKCVFYKKINEFVQPFIESLFIVAVF